MVDGQVVGVTGISGLIGQRLLPLLDASPHVERIVGLDVRDPARRARKLDFHRLDVFGSELTPYLRNVDVVVHLAAVVGPMPDAELFTRVNVDGTRVLLAALGASGVRKVVRPSSVAVYGAWANNPVPITEDAPLRPNPGYLPAIVDAECERLLVEWASSHDGRLATRLRIAPVLGGGASSLLSMIATGRLPVHVRGATPPVQVVHLDDAAAALELAAVTDLDGAYNVAADGWLEHDEARALLPVRRTPPLPAELAERVLAAAWATGLGDAPPSVLPYLVHPYVVANDRLKQAGWKPGHSNDETILLATGAEPDHLVVWLAAAGAATAVAALSAWLLRWRRSRNRRRSVARV
ncbi:MAG TPA: NAD-dependent epimerase/dehydratase family protein [Acidimicrobiia bacterium]|nr:NAD-dependent epimerase/dehydratase family protein [Acidimicrobiia bacterium]